jgi:predicted Rossmann fold flavoprotein
MTATHDAIVLGAGAAGMMCASVAGQRGRRVALLEHAETAGKKILISGGGRCNFTNLGATGERYLSQNAHFAKSALSRYTPQDFLAMVERYGIAWHEKKLGQLFCDGSSRQIVAMLLEECARGNVDIGYGMPITEVTHADGLFQVIAGGQRAAAPKLVIATGGPAIPQMGATSFAYDLARQFGLKVVQPRPALVPLTLSGDEALFTSLSGVSSEVVARCGKTAFREAALLTHRGLSGPVILQISSYWRHGEQIGIDYLPDHAPGWLIDAKRHNPRTTLRRQLRDALPERLATTLADQLGLEGDLGNVPDRALAAAQARLADWRFTPNGSEGYAKAEVAAGGISTADLSSKTMEARRMPGLFAIGEAVDVTGWLGGYNFQWAWASGWVAAQSL